MSIFAAKSLIVQNTAVSNDLCHYLLGHFSSLASTRNPTSVILASGQVQITESTLDEIREIANSALASTNMCGTLYRGIYWFYQRD